MNKLYVALCGLVAVSVLTIVPTIARSLKIGDVAPAFTLVNQDGRLVSLSQFRGQKVALCFYPSESTPFCRKQVKNMGVQFARAKKLGITILGISTDSTKKHKKFAHEYNISFDLLTVNKRIMKAYGVNNGFFSKLFGKANRVTFLIDEQGIVVGIIDNVALGDHVSQIIEGFNLTLLDMPK